MFVRLKLFLLFVAVSALTRVYMLPAGLLDIDESAHITGSWVMMNGGSLYTDFVDNKPPLLYVAYALPQALFGRGLLAVHLFVILIVVPWTAFACSAFYDHKRKGILAGLLFLIYSSAYLAHDMHAAHADLLMLLPATWALVMARDEMRAAKASRVFCAGLFVGIAVLLKHQIILWTAAILIACVFECVRSKKSKTVFRLAASLAIGAFVPMALACGWFAWHGALDAMIYWNVTTNFIYSANPISVHEATGRFIAGIVPFLLVTSPLWWLFRKSAMSRYQRVLTAATLAFSAIAVAVGFRFFPHYFVQLYVPLCLGAAPAAAAILNPLERGGKAFVAFTVSIWTLSALMNSALYYGDRRIYREKDPVFARVAERLHEDSCFQNASLFVWGYTPLYYHTQLRPASRFAVLSQSGLTDYVSGNLQKGLGIVRREHWNLLMSDLEKNRATYIIDTSPSGIFRWNRYPLADFPLLDRYVKQNYTRLENIDGIELYRRNACHP